MQYRSFGRLGWLVGEIGYGMWGLAGWSGSDDDETAAARDFRQELVGPQQAAHRFAQIDDMNEIALAVNIRPHLRIPAAGAMAEMNAGLDQVFHLDNRHALPSRTQAATPCVHGNR